MTLTQKQVREGLALAEKQRLEIGQTTDSGYEIALRDLEDVTEAYRECALTLRLANATIQHLKGCASDQPGFECNCGTQDILTSVADSLDNADERLRAYFGEE